MKAESPCPAHLACLTALLGLCAALLLTGCSADLPEAELPLAGQLRLGAVLGEGSADGFAMATLPRRFEFPADHGPHPEFRSEWWYLTVALSDASGAELGVQFTLFRQALRPEPVAPANPWQTTQIYLAHFAVTDVEANRHRAHERFARGHPSLAGVEAAPFKLWLEDWRLVAEAGGWRLIAATGEQAVDLLLTMDQPVVLQGDAGLSRKGPQQASYYYSVPGIPVTGRVRAGGRTRQVTGRAWLDREWSTSVLSAGQVGWDWLALDLGGNRRAMVYQLRRRDGFRDPFDQGLLIEPDGRVRRLVADDFRLRPLRHWRDDDGTRWPVAWLLELDGHDYRVEALVDDQKMDTSVSYWEGLVAVYDSTGARSGRGYLEMTGYQDVIEGNTPAVPTDLNGETGQKEARNSD
jgi:predicted secreted hydrolase